MHRQGGNFPERALVQFRRVDEIGSGDADFGGTLIIISRRGAFGGFRRNFLYAIGQAGQAAEQAGHFAIDDLGHPCDLLHQVFGCLGVILRVGPQMLDKRFAAWISRFCCDLDHLGANARHFVQADLMDLLCGQGRRCFFTNAERIIFGTARLRRYAGCCGASRLVACGIPCELFVQRGVNDRADRGFGRFGKACKVRFGNARGPLFRIWFVETRCIHVGRNQPADRSFKTL